MPAQLRYASIARRGTARLLAAGGIALLFALLLAPSLRAADDKGDDKRGEAKTLLAEIGKARKAEGQAGLGAVVERVPDVHNALEDAPTRKKLQAVLGKILEDEAAGNARSMAATALGRLNDPKGAFAALSKALPKPKDTTVAPAQLEALRATAALAPEAAVARLVQLVQKGKSLPASREAILALGGYGKAKKRESILKALLETMTRYHAAAKAAQKDPKHAGGDAAWKALGESFVSAANKLTGQAYTDGPAWLDAYKQHKKNLGVLFAGQEAPKAAR